MRWIRCKLLLYLQIAETRFEKLKLPLARIPIGDRNQHGSNFAVLGQQNRAICNLLKDFFVSIPQLRNGNNFRYDIVDRQEVGSE